MSFPSVENFDVSIIKRTTLNLNAYKGEYEFTMLINSLLGLLVIPNECIINKKRKFNFDFLNRKLPEIKRLGNIFNKQDFIYLEYGKEIKESRILYISSKGQKKDIKDITFGQIIRSMRNGIAHFGFKPLKTDGDWSGLVISNKKEEKLNFKIYLTKCELQYIILFLTKNYISDFKI